MIFGEGHCKAVKCYFLILTVKIMDTLDCAVIGAGVVGLAVARELATMGREVIILESEESFGTQTSARNSEVIHAGIYYASGSMKAQLCVPGRKALFEYCAEHQINHQRIGKLVVACDESELSGLKKYKAQAEANGVNDLEWLTGEQLNQMEPAVRCVAGFLSPSTGIIDSHGLMLSYLGEAQDHGAMLAVQSPVLGGQVEADGIVLEVGGKEPTTIKCRSVVNCAGLLAPAVSRSIRGIPKESIPPSFFAIGHYYTLSRPSPFTRLIYPVARPDWLGVHVTIDLGGRVRFGPDFEWTDGIDYTFDETREASFYQAIRHYYPDLPDGSLQPGYTGIRPRITGPGEPVQDFTFQTEKEHGVHGLTALYGVESPGLTSSLAIAKHVAGLMKP
jgi:L-2-hydroxyglutarate oxidase LhgO